MGEGHMTLQASSRGLTAPTRHFLLSAAVLAVATQLFAQGPPPGYQPTPPPPTAGINATLDPDGSSATYIVTEQLVGINFPNDAKGTTPTLSGSLVIAPDGSIPVGSSKLTADLRNLKSDQDQRDGYVRKNVLETDKFPTAEFVPTKIDGLPKMIPFTGQARLQNTGNLTGHGVTKEVTFQGIATFNRNGTIAGRAKTTFNFASFNLNKPTIARLMSVHDKITLSVVYRLKRS